MFCAVAALLPVLGFQILGEWDARRTRERLVREEAIRLVNLLAAEQQRIVEGARQLLTAMAAFPEALVGPQEDCQARLIQLLSRFDRYGSMGVIGADGKTLCSARPTPQPVNVADRAYFREAMQTGAFTVGEFIVGRRTGQGLVPFVLPYRDGTGTVAGTVQLGLSVTWLGEQLARLNLPNGAAATVMDRNGIILARHPALPEFVGRPAPEPIRELMSKSAVGIADAAGLDGVQRVIAYAPTGTQPGGLGVLVGLSKQEAFRELERANRRGILLILSGALLAALLMALAATHLVRRPAARLLQAVNRLSGGDLSARTRLPAEGSEFDRLGAAFDAMADRLQARERGLRTALESTTDSVFVLDREGRFTYVNRRAQAQLGDGHDLVGQEIWAAFPKLADSPFGVATRSAVATGRPAHVDAFYPPLGRYFEAHAYPGPDGLTVFFRDITESRRAEALLAESEEQFRTLAESIPQLAWMADGSGWVFWFNRRWYEYTGTAFDEVQGWKWRKLLHPAHEARVVEKMNQSWSGGGPWEDTFPLRGQEGTYRWFLSRALPIRNEAGVVVRWFGTHTDITEQREAEAMLEARVAERTAQLAASEARLRVIFEHAPDMFLVVREEADGGFTYEVANPATARFLGRAEAEILGQRVEALLPEDMVETVLDCFRSCVAGNAPMAISFVFGSGSAARTAETVLVPLRDPASGTVQVIICARDVTGRQELERRLAQAQKLEAVGQLTGGVAHDFNNLLQVVAGNIDLAQATVQRGEGERALRLLDNARRAIGRGARLTGQLLAFSRRQVLRAERVVASRLVAEMGDLFRRAAGETIRLETQSQLDLWPCRVDPSQFESALLNLVLNARDAMPEGGTIRIALQNVTLAAEAALAVEELPPGDYVQVEVADTGQGMTPEVLAHAFEPFFTTKEVGYGSGLGLAQVHGFVRQSGGGVTIHSAVGRGTRILLYFPRDRGAASAEAGDGAESAVAPTPALAVLLVEDDSDVLDAVQVMLSDAGHRVIPARDGAEALRVLRSDQGLDVLVSDVVMPGGISGVDLAREARRLRPHLRVVLTSGYAADLLARHGAGAEFDVLAKPYPQSELLRRIAA